jgi:hypothetical protein
MSDKLDTIPWEELNKPFHLRQRKYRGSKTMAEIFAEREAQAPPLRAIVEIPKPAELRTAQRTELSATALPIKSKPLSECDDNPVLNEQGAAFIVGVSADLLKKWRQRKQGPDYIQYGTGGPVRYEIKALLAFRDEYRVYLSSKRYGHRETPAGP